MRCRYRFLIYCRRHPYQCIVHAHLMYVYCNTKNMIGRSSPQHDAFASQGVGVGVRLAYSWYLLSATCFDDLQRRPSPHKHHARRNFSHPMILIFEGFSFSPGSWRRGVADGVISLLHSRLSAGHRILAALGALYRGETELVLYQRAIASVPKLRAWRRLRLRFRTCTFIKY